ncbi:MAG: nucleotidyltransferase family protein [Saprospiraceae bacterium]|nr:nucleotidyltransferase family protein [Saprospiraceae bacterium]
MVHNLNQHTIVGFLRENKPLLQSKMGVLRIGLFGSYATGEAGPDSDIDILVELETPDFMRLMALHAYLEEKLGKSIDLLRIGPHLRPSFLKSLEKEVIYA